MPNSRTASRPAAGAGREGVRLALAGLVLYCLEQILPAEIMGHVGVLVFAAIAIGAAAAGKWLRERGLGLGRVLALALVLLVGLAASPPARAADPACAHMTTTPDLEAELFLVESGNVAICTPALTRLGNPLPADLLIESCVVEFGDTGSSFTAPGPLEQAAVVLTPIPVALEFDNPMQVYCTAGGLGGEVLATVARFPFSGPGPPGRPR